MRSREAFAVGWSTMVATSSEAFGVGVGLTGKNYSKAAIPSTMVAGGRRQYQVIPLGGEWEESKKLHTHDLSGWSHYNRLGWEGGGVLRSL